MIVYACGVLPQTQAYLTQIVAAVPHARLLITETRMDHGAVIGRLIDETSADHVLLCEDDAFVRRPGVIDETFRRIESGQTDIIGTGRGNTTPELIEAAEVRWGLPPKTATGETGLSLYPCFYFGRRSDLLATDRNYAARNWKPGEMIPGLDIPAETGQSADTFVATSWQLRAAGLRIEVEPAYRSNEAMMSSWGAAPWFHVGSLSSGYGCAFMVADDAAHHDYIASFQDELYDWHKRVSWWQRAWDCWDGEIAEQHEEYGRSLDQLIADARMNTGAVASWRAAFNPLVTWAERP